MSARRWKVEQVEIEVGVPRPFVEHCIRNEWVLPAGAEPLELDEEDVARLRLIRELREDFGANDEAIPLILHLVDQLHCLMGELSRRRAA